MLQFIAPLLLLVAPGDPVSSSIESFTEPYRKIDVAPPEPGLVATLSVQEGDRVKKGQLLAALDCDLLLVSLQIAKTGMESHGRLDSATAERDLRKARLHKLDELRAAGHASGEEVERARADLAIAEGSLIAAQEQLTIDSLEYQKTQAMIERRMMRSPIDGLVTRVYKEEREFVAANAPTVLSVVQLDPLRIVFSVPTSLAAGLKSGGRVRLAFSESGLDAKGRIELVSPITDAESGTVRVKVLVDNPRGQYRCGVRCSLELDDPTGNRSASAR